MIFKGSDRRSDIDKVYSKLLQVMFDNIERISFEHEKIPPEIIMFGKLVDVVNYCSKCNIVQVIK